mgnify:CR=1 FL=1
MPRKCEINIFRSYLKRKEKAFNKIKLITQNIKKMYSVHMTPGRSSDKQGTSKNVDTEVGVYKNRRKQSIPVKVFNYLKTQMQEGISSK